MDTDTIFCILSHLEFGDIRNCALVNKQFNTSSKYELLWLRLCEQDHAFISTNNHLANYKKCYIMDIFLRTYNSNPCTNKVAKITTLIIIEHHLKTIPQEISMLRNLHHLNLNKCGLESIPTAIGLLINLGYLYLWTNELESIPQEIGLLINLKVLDLSRNQLRFIPKEIGNLQRLKKFDLYCNSLTTIPNEVIQLCSKNKISLYMDVFQLEVCPKESSAIIESMINDGYLRIFRSY